MSLQRGGEHLLADRAAFILAGRVEARTPPGHRIALDDERAHAGRVAVVVRVEGAERVRHEGLRQRIEAASVVPYQANLSSSWEIEVPKALAECRGGAAS